MRASTKERISQEVMNWRHQDLIDAAVSDRLAARYGVGAGLGSAFLRWLGFFALFLLGMSVLGFIGMAMGETLLYVAPVVLAAAAYAAWHFGRRLATDPEQHYAVTGSILISVCLLCGYAAMATSAMAYGGVHDGNVFLWLLLVTATAAFAMAYRYALRWPLTIAILIVFHALGNWHSYGGHGSYYLGITDERITLLLGAVSLAIGCWHERVAEADDNNRRIGFGHLYVVFGLLYINLSCWFLSLYPGGLTWVLVFTLCTIAQLVAGARAHDRRLIGFGVVFLCIDVYTRFFEHFWDELSKGTFFLLAGGVAVAVGVALESKARATQGGTHQ